MHDLVLTLHSLVRWAVLSTGAVAVVGVLRQGTAARRRAIPFLVALDLQLLLGLSLYLVLSPLTAWHGPPGLRFWRIDHPALGIIAIALGNAGAVVLLRARQRLSAVAAVLLCAAFAGLFATIPWTRPLFRL